MSTWLTEHPTGAYIVLVLIGLIFVVAFFSTRRVVHLFYLLGVIALMGLVFLVDTLVVTDREQVEASVLAMARAAEKGDIDGIDKLLSASFSFEGENRDALLARARKYLLPPEPRTISFYNLNVPRSDNPRRLECLCNVTVYGQFSGLNLNNAYIGTIDFVLEKEADDVWRIKSMIVKNFGGHPMTLPR